MAAQTQLPDILSGFTAATDIALNSLPASESILPPENGITLLDAKNEIFLSYLQGLALRNLNIVRALKNGSSLEDAQELNDKITKKLVEQRVYLERGVRPLEGKIRYQVERVVKAAEDEERTKKQKEGVGRKVNGYAKKGAGKDDEDASGSGLDSDSGSDSSEENDDALARPNAASLNQSTRKDTSNDSRASKSQSSTNGVYRPPRISATTMPDAPSKKDKTARPARSRTVDDYIASEMSTAPTAEPSIGSTIAAGGRRDKDARQLAREAERRNYEESNFVRLPKQSKAEQARMGGNRDRQREGGGFGGEEWRGLGESVDRIAGATKKGRGVVLDRSRKRKDAGGNVDGPRGDGVGDAFERKRRRVMKKRR